MKRSEKIQLVACLIVIAAFGYAFYDTYQLCKASNGTLVRGVWWLECIP